MIIVTGVMSASIGSAVDTAQLQPYTTFPGIAVPYQSWLTRLWGQTIIRNAAGTFRVPLSVQYSVSAAITGDSLHASKNNDMVLDTSAQDTPGAVYGFSQGGNECLREWDKGSLRLTPGNGYILNITVREPLAIGDVITSYWEYGYERAR